MSDSRTGKQIELRARSERPQKVNIAAELPLGAKQTGGDVGDLGSGSLAD